jgi:hypothetical protein
MNRRIASSRGRTRRSARRPPCVPAVPRAGLAALLLACLLGAPAAPAGARVFLTVEEALELAFPGCRVSRETVYLTAGQVARVGELAGEAPDSALAHPYVARCPTEKGETGRAADGSVAYFDTHRVRTLPETLMVVVGPDGEVARIEVLAFKEPPDYIPREAWYEQFFGRELGPDLELKRAIRPVTGATLTARATTDAVRRVLALHEVLRDDGVLPDRAGRPARTANGGHSR